MEAETFLIQSKGEADYYLSDLLKRPEYRSVHELEFRANKYIKNEALKAYLVTRGKELLLLPLETQQ